MKFSEILRWVGPAAIAGGVMMVFSDLLGLTVYLPGIEEAAPTGYHAVGSGLILWVMILLLVGMIGLYARLPKPDESREAAAREARYRALELTGEDHDFLERELRRIEEESPALHGLG